MKKLVVGTITGIFNQLLSPEQTISGKSSYLENNYLDINSWFWSEQLEIERLKKDIHFLKLQKNDMPIKIQWAIQNQNHYLNLVEQTKKLSSWNELKPEELYYHLEMLQVACNILYYAETAPFQLDICSGFRRGSDSAKEMRENCIFPHSNPYLYFIKNKILPAVIQNKPDILWLTGKPDIASFSLAILVKSQIPSLHIGSVYHSTEYYSLNKLIPLLMQNHDFFHVFEIVVLCDENNTMNAVEDAYNRDESLSDIPNILFTTDGGNTIIKNTINTTQPRKITYFKLNDNKPVDIKLFPQQHCYWNKCSFCGINHKYLSMPMIWDFDTAFDVLHLLQKKGITKIWMTDEALPYEVLLKLCNKIIDENWEFEWHFRSRIEQWLLNDNFVDKLKKAGLKNILLGLESASERILKLMNKTAECSRYIEIAENIVKKYNEKGISVHFPVIIGFPGETSEERNRTITFLKYLKDSYPLFSYNINILELDISSKLYHDFAEYDISMLRYPCKPASFIGNSVEWEFQDKEILRTAQQDGMRYFFRWYPQHSFLDIISFYKLLEHTRLPFWHKELYQNSKRILLDADHDYIRINENVKLLYGIEQEIILFHEETLDYLEGGNFLKKIYSLKNWTFCKTLFYDFPDEFHKSIRNVLQNLVDYKMLIIRR